MYYLPQGENMKQELDEKLCKAFPNLYADRHGDMRTTAACWGFEFSDGWFDIIWRLSEKLEPMILKIKQENPRRTIRFLKAKEKWNHKIRTFWIDHFAFKKDLFNRIMTWIILKLIFNIDQPEYPRAVQMKEKYGTLRFYMNCETEEMSQAIAEAERESAHTCERCGSKEGKLNRYGWVSCECDKCRGFNLEEREEEYRKKYESDNEDKDTK